MPLNIRTHAAFLAAFLVLVTTPAHAKVRLPAIFGDHMVLQQDGKIPV